MRSLKDLMDLHSRVALVTGGGGHIGTVLCEALAELGAAVVVADVRAENCQMVVDLLRQSFDVNATPLVVDLADEQAVRAIPDQVERELGRLDILVHCAAFVGTSNLSGWVTPFEHQSADTWRRALEINLTSGFVLAQSCAPLIRASGHGSIVNISSIYGVVGPDLRLYENTSLGNPAAYAASKGGLLQLTRWLATVLAPHIRVNAITPGGLWREQPEGFRRRYIERTPLQRMATEEDLKGAIAYLASDLSAYMTGHNLVVDGGWTVW